jgi:hypothetical protein
MRQTYVARQMTYVNDVRLGHDPKIYADLSFIKRMLLKGVKEGVRNEKDNTRTR